MSVFINKVLLKHSIVQGSFRATVRFECEKGRQYGLQNLIYSLLVPDRKSLPSSAAGKPTANFYSHIWYFL